ncbi:polyphenol oxidase, chloroplastic-like [Senna tora]|uniref:Polyphenol oxidase, chloroplastic-like n=1 Tax=Senna tora TaxID=362788 RepID=A0A834SFM4_9FABA|nr:polyphenol oxidase, chloroplastic-like [Senna tora]
MLNEALFSTSINWAGLGWAGLKHWKWAYSYHSFTQQANIHCAYCDGAYHQVGFPEMDLQVHNSWLFLPFHRWPKPVDLNFNGIEDQIRDCLDPKQLGYVYQDVDIPWLRAKPTPRGWRIWVLKMSMWCLSLGKATSPLEGSTFSFNPEFNKRRRCW